jgi:hypothetical protein
MASTSNAPDNLFGRIEKEPENTCLCKRIFLNYTYGIGKIHTREKIEKARQSHSFEREYNLKYLGKIGSVFPTKRYEAAIEKASRYNLNVAIPFSYKSIDPAYGSSAFGIIVTQWVDGIVQILHIKRSFTAPPFQKLESIGTIAIPIK